MQLGFLQNPDIHLRGYQEQALIGARNLFDAGFNRLLKIMATGLGKTIAFASAPGFFPELAQFGVLVVVHTDELAEQAMAKLRLVNPMLRIGLEKAQYRADPASQIVVTSRQTLGRSGTPRLARLLRTIPFGIVIVDEAHHLRAGGQYDNILTPLGLGSDREVSSLLPNGKQRLLIGVTATPNRADGIGLSAFMDEIVCNYDLRFGITEGYLCDIEAYSIDTDTHIENVSTSKGDFTTGELEEAVNTEVRNNLIVSAWKKYSGAPFIGFTVDVRHAHDLAKCFNAAGVPAMAIDGKTPPSIRLEALRQYREGEIMGLLNCAVLTEGYDAPHTDTILMCRPTKSSTLYQQMLGRGSRTSPPDIGNLPTKDERLAAIAGSGKPAMKLIDFMDVAGKHQLISLPSLIGLNPKLKAQGKKLVAQIAEFVERKERENPGQAKAMREASTFEEMEVQATKINVWSMSHVSDGVKKISTLRWITLPDGTMQLDVPANQLSDMEADRRKFAVRVEPDTLGRYHATAIYPGQRLDGNLVEGSEIKVGDYRNAEDAVRDMDKRIKQKFGEVSHLMEHSPSWGGGKPTDGQIQLLRKLKVDFPMKNGTPDMTKAEASAAITAALAMKNRQPKKSRYAAAAA